MPSCKLISSWLCIDIYSEFDRGIEGIDMNYTTATHSNSHWGKGLILFILIAFNRSICNGIICTNIIRLKSFAHMRRI